MSNGPDSAHDARTVLRLLHLHHQHSSELERARIAMAKSYAKQVETLGVDVHDTVWPALGSAAALARTLPRRAFSAVVARLPDALRETFMDSVYSFDALAGLPAREIQELVRRSDKRVLAIALLGADDSIFHAVTSNMSKRAAGMLRDDMESLLATGELRTRDVQEARGALSSFIRQLNSTFQEGPEHDTND